MENKNKIVYGGHKHSPYMDKGIVRVIPPVVVTSIEIIYLGLPDPITNSETFKFYVRAYYSNDTTAILEDTDPELVWVSSSIPNLTIDSTGLATAGTGSVPAISVTVTAVYEGSHNDSVTVNVEDFYFDVELISLSDDQNSICSPVIFLKAVVNGNMQYHTFEWVQIDNQPVVVLTDDDTFVPSYSSDNLNHTFRFYLDRGTEAEQFADTYIYSTPTEPVYSSLQFTNSRIKKPARFYVETISIITALSTTLAQDTMAHGDNGIINPFILSWSVPVSFTKISSLLVKKYNTITGNFDTIATLDNTTNSYSGLISGSIYRVDTVFKQSTIGQFKYESESSNTVSVHVSKSGTNANDVIPALSSLSQNINNVYIKQVTVKIANSETPGLETENLEYNHAINNNLNNLVVLLKTSKIVDYTWQGLDDELVQIHISDSHLLNNLIVASNSNVSIGG